MRGIFDDIRFGLLIAASVAVLLLLVLFVVCFHDFMTWMGNLG
jgi:hypothetical protein